MVSNYIDNNCKYNLNKLVNVVYLIDEDAVKDIRIDNGDAYIASISQNPLELKCYGIKLTENDSLDERYKFTHTLTFSVNGYANHNDFQDRYYVIVKDEDETYWLVNPLFPCKVTYTYNLGYNQDHTDFTLATASNHPMLEIHNFSAAETNECNSYRLGGIDKLWLNEKRYTVHSGNSIKYTNDGFKEVDFKKTSPLLTETFNGDNISHAIKFNIGFDNYKTSWHYNLLEFIDNTYASVIKTKNNEYTLCGFSYGMQPSYTINADDTLGNPNYIEITLSDSHDVGDTLDFYDSVTYEYLGTKTWEYTKEHDGYECVTEGFAKYLLMKQVDALGNETNKYMCLEGYEQQFADLDIIDTFDDVVLFSSIECGGMECMIDSSIPSTVVFNSTNCKTFYLKSDTPWTATSSSNYITISPSTGAANVEYDVRICNSLIPTATANTSTITVNYCNSAMTYNVSVVENDDCLPQGRTYNISANAQTLTIPTNCCVESVRETIGVGSIISIYSNYITVQVPENNTGLNRTISLLAVYCDGKSSNIIINQSNVFERWSDDSTFCIGYSEYKRQYKYTGSTSSSMDTRTDEYRDILIRENSPNCGYVEPLYRWVDIDGYLCSGTTKYHIAKQQVSLDNGSTYNDVVPSVTGTGTLWESLSTDCGYIPRRPPEGVLYKYWGYTESGADGDGTLLTYDDQTFIEQTAWGLNQLTDVELVRKGQTSQIYGYVGDHVSILTNFINNSCPKSEYRGIEIPNSVLSIANFFNFSSLGSLTLPNNLIYFTGLYGDRKISSITLPETLVSIPTFTDCPNLKTLTIPKNVSTVSSTMFVRTLSENCGSSTYRGKWNIPYFESLHFKGKIPPYCGYSRDFPELSNPFPIYVPTESLNLYKAAFREYVDESRIFGGEATDDTYSDNYKFRVSYAGGGTQTFPIDNCYLSLTDNSYDFDQPLSAITQIVVSDTVKEVLLNQPLPSLSTLILGSNVKTVKGYGEMLPLNSVTLNSGLLWIDKLFAHSPLTTVTLPSSLLYIGESTFYGSSITNITIPNRVKHIAYAAFSGSSLNSITIPSNVISISTLSFGGCNNLTSVTIENGVKHIGYYAFSGCTHLTGVTIPSSVEFIGNHSFAGCSGLTKIVLESSTPPYIGTVADGHEPYHEGEQIAGTSHVVMLTEAFSGSTCPICVPANAVDTYKTAFGWSVYADRICSSDVCNQPQPQNIKFSAQYAGGGSYTALCNSDTTLTSSVTKPSGYDYTRMIQATVGDCITNIGPNAFNSCIGLTSCTIGSGVTSVGSDAFYCCTSLASIDIPSGVTTIGSDAFNSCSGLTTANIPSGSIGQSAFQNCSGLTSCTLGDGVTTIGKYAFNNCTSMTSVTIGSGCTNIGDSTFSQCTALNGIVITAPTPPSLYRVKDSWGYWTYTSFNNTNNCPIYVPSAYLSDYQNTTKWPNAYKSRLQAIT